MKSVSVYETFDRKRHDSIQSAQRHLDNLFANKVSYVANNIPLGRGVGVSEWIVDNLEVFLEMKKIKDDMELFKD